MEQQQLHLSQGSWQHPAHPRGILETFHSPRGAAGHGDTGTSHPLASVSPNSHNRDRICPSLLTEHGDKGHSSPQKGTPQAVPCEVSCTREQQKGATCGAFPQLLPGLACHGDIGCCSSFSLPKENQTTSKPTRFCLANPTFPPLSLRRNSRSTPRGCLTWQPGRRAGPGQEQSAAGQRRGEEGMKPGKLLGKNNPKAPGKGG